MSKKKEYDSERETRVLLEDVRSQLKVVAEGHGLLVGRLDKVEAKLTEHDQRFDRIDGRLDRVEGRLDGVDGRLDGVENQLGQIQKQVGSVLIDHESRLKTLEAK